MVADRKVFLKSLLMITVTCFIARCLEISPVLRPSAFCLFTGGKWPKEEVQEREKAEGLEDAGAESELTGSTEGGPGKDKMHGFLFFLFLFQLAGERGPGLCQRRASGAGRRGPSKGSR